jgi:hypothetical protein
LNRWPDVRLLLADNVGAEEERAARWHFRPNSLAQLAS